MLLEKKVLVKKYINFLSFSLLLDQNKVSKNFYTLILKNKLATLNIVKITQYLKFLINFLHLQYKKEKHFLFIISKSHHLLFKLYQLKFNYSYVSNKWSGGILTNFLTIKNQIDIFQNYNINSTYTKKEQNILRNKKKKFMRIFEGLNNIKALPNIIIFLTNNISAVSIKECLNLGIIPITMLNLDKKFFTSPYIIPITENSELFIKFLLDKIFD